jgi:hypothetical protein
MHFSYEPDNLDTRSPSYPLKLVSKFTFQPFSLVWVNLQPRTLKTVRKYPFCDTIDFDMFYFATSPVFNYYMHYVFSVHIRFYCNKLGNQKPEIGNHLLFVAHAYTGAGHWFAMIRKTSDCGEKTRVKTCRKDGGFNFESFSQFEVVR